MDFDKALLIATTAFFMEMKFVNTNKEQIFDGLSRLHALVKTEIDNYCTPDSIVSFETKEFYFTQNFDLLGKLYAQKWLTMVKLEGE
jgi:hypothetical protein